MQEPQFNETINERAMEHIEEGQVYVTAAQDPDYRDRTGVVRVTEGPIPDPPDVVVEVLESWEDGKISNEVHEVSVSPYTFVARLYHREGNDAE